MQKEIVLGNNPELAATILSCIGDGVIVTDLNATIIYINHIAEEILGCTADNVLGMQFKEVFKVYQADTEVRRSCPVDYVLKNHIKTGLMNNSILLDKNIPKYVSATCTAVNAADGTIMGVVVVFRDITRIKTIELDHLNEEKNLNEMFENAPAGMMVIDKSGSLLRTNESILKYFGKKKENIIGKRVGEIINCTSYFTNSMGCGHGERCNSCKIEQAVYEAFSNKQATRNIEVKMQLNKNDHVSEVWFRASISPLADTEMDEVVIALVDISSSKHNEIKAMEASEYCNNILNQLPFTIWMTDEHFNWKYMNKRYGEVTGADLYDRPLENWFDFAHPDDAKDFKKSVLKAVRKKTLFLKEVRFRIKNNEYKWCMVVGAPFYGQDGRFNGYIGSSYDISLQKEAEEDLKRYQKLLITAKEAAEAANRAKSEFLANMSHEIRTPINGIVGMIDLTMLLSINEEQKDNLITAKACAGSLLRIVNDILDFSKMEADKMILDANNFDIKELIEEIVRAHSPKVSAKGLELNYIFSSNLPQFLIGDPNRLRQVLDNLVSNAVKFTDQGEVTITIKCNRFIGDEVELEFTVTDTGIGIAKEDRNRLFHSFSQIESTYTKKYGGTGLGLVISKQLVEKMGGSIDVDSEEGKGSSFHFNLRFRVGNSRLSEKQILPDLSKAVKQLRILLVEDDYVNQKVAYKILKRKGYHVDVACNGNEALHKYENQEFDVILMDIQMPEMNGIEATKMIRQREQKNHHIPIVAMTAYALPGDKEKFLRLGMDAYISKPLKLEELFYILDEVTKENKPIVPESIKIADDGEVVYAFDKPKYSKELNVKVLKQINTKIQLISEETNQNDFASIEHLANEIKVISNSMNTIDIKDSAFKLEMSARRENKSELMSGIEDLKQIIRRYHISNG